MFACGFDRTDVVQVQLQQSARVEIAGTDTGFVPVRDSKQPAPVVSFSTHSWSAFVADTKGAHSGETAYVCGALAPCSCQPTETHRAPPIHKRGSMHGHSRELSMQRTPGRASAPNSGFPVRPDDHSERRTQPPERLVSAPPV